MAYLARTLCVLSFLGLFASFQACASNDDDGGSAGKAGKSGAAGSKQDGGTGGKAGGGTGGKGGKAGKGGTAGEEDGAGGEPDGEGGGGPGGSDGIGGNGGEPGGSGPGPGKPCATQGTGGPAMVELSLGFCIDSTEVTREQYAAWLAKTPDTTKQEAYCAWNTDFNPDASCMKISGVCTSDCDKHPQVCVDWCDAAAFCKGVGKRLCGKIGGGDAEKETYKDPKVSQWFYACSSDGTHAKYPYSDTFDPHTCNVPENGVATTVPVGSLTGCQSGEEGFGGVFDLVGNVQEWSAECDGYDSDSDYCQWRGGSFKEGLDAICDSAISSPRTYTDRTVGFRCCN